MTGQRLNDTLLPDAMDGQASPVPAMRSDLETMLLPFFPEDGQEDFITQVGDYTVRMHSSVPGTRIATATDRKVLNLLAAQIGTAIRAGTPPSRHVEIGVRDIMEAISYDPTLGGSEYARITERLERLAATWITTEMPIGDDVSRKRQFRWIDAFEQDVQAGGAGQKVLRLKITLSEDAFRWILGMEGFEIPRDEFRTLTASRPSSWRVFEICLARLIRNGGEPVWIPLDELRRRIPIASDLKVFKARTLKSSMAAIAENPQMSGAISLSLEAETEDGFAAIAPRQRVRLDKVHVCVRKGPLPLPEIDRLLPASETRDALMEDGM